MSEEDALLAAIYANPDDDTPRLVYADWLDEHDQPARAEFIRVQVRIAALMESNDERQRLMERERELLGSHRAEWAAEVGIIDLEKFDVQFERGFPGVLFCEKASATELNILHQMPDLRLLVLNRCETTSDVWKLVAGLRQLEVFTYGMNAVTDVELAAFDRLPPRTVIRADVALGMCDPRVWTAFLERRQNRIATLPLAERRDALKWLRHFNTSWPCSDRPARTVEFGTWGVFDAELRLLAAFPEVEEISIGESSVTAAGLRHLARLPNLKALTLGCSPIDSITPLAECLALESLELLFEDIPGFEYGAEFGDEATVGLDRLTNLRRLSLVGCNTGRGTVRRLKDLRRLSTLKLDSWAPPGGLGTDELRVIADLTELEHLTLNAWLWTANLHSFVSLSKLQSLALHIYGGSAEEFQHLAKLTELRELKLSGKGVTEEGLQKLLTLPNLRTLELRETAVSERGARVIALRTPGLAVTLDGRAIESVTTQ